MLCAIGGGDTALDTVAEACRWAWVQVAVGYETCGHYFIRCHARLARAALLFLHELAGRARMAMLPMSSVPGNFDSGQPTFVVQKIG